MKKLDCRNKLVSPCKRLSECHSVASKSRGKNPQQVEPEQGLERKAEQSDEPLQKEMERKSGFPFAMSATEKDSKTGLPWEVMKLTRRVSSMTLEEPMRKRHRLNPYPTWAQVKT
nr:PREDICTED: uncharacterized protein LOC106701476 [Bos mutus]